MPDNIGGISVCEYALVDDVKNCAVLSDGILIRFNQNKNWNEFPSTKTKNEVKITSANDDSGTYTADASLSIPTFKLADKDEIMLINNQKVLLKYRTQNGNIYIVGDKENFLIATVDILNPTAVSGYSGIKITLKGTLQHPELPLL